MGNMYIKSKRPGLLMKHTGKPTFKILFDGTVKVSEEVGKFLLEDKPGLIVESTEAEYKKSQADRGKEEKKILTEEEIKAKNRAWQSWYIKEHAGEKTKVPSTEEGRIKLIIELKAKQGGK